jgi:hypothetical protein
MATVTRPDLERGFRVPLVPVLPRVGAAHEAAGRAVVYAVYGYRNSRLRREV